MKEFGIIIKSNSTAEMKADLIMLMDELDNVPDFVENAQVDEETQITECLRISRTE